MYASKNLVVLERSSLDKLVDKFLNSVIKALRNKPLSQKKDLDSLILIKENDGYFYVWQYLSNRVSKKTLTNTYLGKIPKYIDFSQPKKPKAHFN